MPQNFPDEHALTYLREDFAEVASQCPAAACVYAWTDGDSPVPDLVWGFVARRNEIGFPGMGRLPPPPIESTERLGRIERHLATLRRRLLSSDEKPEGLLKILPHGKSCVWWSPSVTAEWLHDFNGVSARAIALLDPLRTDKSADTGCEPGSRWIAIAREFARADSAKRAGGDKTVLQAASKEELEAWTTYWKDYPIMEPKTEKTDDFVSMGYLDHLQDMERYLRLRTVMELKALGQSVPRIYVDQLCNPASYSVSAIDQHVKALRRSAAERQATGTTGPNTAAPAESTKSKNELLKDLKRLCKAARIRLLFRYGSKGLLEQKGEEMSLQDLADLANCRGQQTDTLFKEQMLTLKADGIFSPRGRGPYILTSYGGALCDIALEQQSEFWASFTPKPKTPKAKKAKAKAKARADE